MKLLVAKLLSIYKIFISPFLKAYLGEACRFTPTCSQYSKEAIERFGLIKGAQLSLKRLARCHPLFHAGYDPLPQ